MRAAWVEVGGSYMFLYVPICGNIGQTTWAGQNTYAHWCHLLNWALNSERWAPRIKRQNRDLSASDDITFNYIWQLKTGYTKSKNKYIFSIKLKKMFWRIYVFMIFNGLPYIKYFLKMIYSIFLKIKIV